MYVSSLYNVSTVWTINTYEAYTCFCEGNNNAHFIKASNLFTMAINIPATYN